VIAYWLIHINSVATFFIVPFHHQNNSATH
jgi:hypothetical protein